MRYFRSAAALISGLCFLVCAASCGKPSSSDVNLIDAIASHARSTLGDGATAIFHFDDAVDFEFDEVLAFGPYTSFDEIERALGAKNAEVEASGIDMRDDICVLVFRKKKSVVEVVKFPRGRLDLSRLASASPLAATAPVEVARDAADAAWLFVQPPGQP